MIVDLDSHLREEYFMDEVYKLDGPFAEYTPERVGDGKYQHAQFRHRLSREDQKARSAFSHDYIYDPDDHRGWEEIAERQRGGWDMERRLQDAAKEGIDKQLLFPTRIATPTQYPGELGAALCRAYNDWVARLVRGHEDRLLPVAMAPAAHPPAMADELRRAVKELGFKAGHLVVYTPERNLDDPAFFPYYEMAQELNVPLMVHPNTMGELINRFDTFFGQHVLGRPLNCVAALVALVLGGVFERYPRLKVTFFEVSAEFPLYWMHRMDDDYEWAKREPRARKADLPMPPSEYVKRNCYFTCEADELHLGRALEEIPEDHVLMATDYPHFDSEWPHTVAGIRERDDITARQKDLILGENAARLLNL
ncbi:MAG TPA: amidohydrolase family protein [Chloroflexota bacterium]|nr:amidohydrolase family protein [Chloroflexota bacterium]